VAHDFNNLLTGVLGYLDMIRSSADPEIDEYARKAERAAQRACDLTRQLLAYARKTRRELIVHDLNHTLSEVAALIEKTIDPRIDLKIEAGPEAVAVLADPGQMNQVLMNLCINARDAVVDVLEMGGRGAGWRPQIQIRSARVELDDNYPRLHPDARAGEFSCLSVIDNGAGMDAATRARIFDPFFTTKPVGSGTGLGLATLFGIVTQHEGWIEVVSERGMGSIFRVFLPRVDALPEIPSEAAASLRIQGGSETILLVDDEEMIRELGRDILEGKGYRVVLAEDGQKALEAFEREGDSIDLVILDLAMPRLSGREVAPRLRSLRPEVRILTSSGYAADDATVALKSNGICGFVEKPYHTFDLLRAVRRALDSPVESHPS
jgi:two-component system, cell cycle sensor histidine kinase and response regulator CckA